MKEPEASKIRVSLAYSKSLGTFNLGTKTLGGGLNLIV